MNCTKRILHPTSGRFLEVYSNNPGLQVYTGNKLPHQYIYPPDLEDHEWRNDKNVQINFWKSVKCVIVIKYLSYF